MTISRTDTREGREPSFSIYEFKSWLEKQSDSDLKFPKLSSVYEVKKAGDSAGQKVQSRLGLQRLEDQIQKHNSDLDESRVHQLAKKFKDEGGVVTETLTGLKVMIETRNGSFALPKIYTKPSS